MSDHRFGRHPANLVDIGPDVADSGPQFWFHFRQMLVETGRLRRNIGRRVSDLVESGGPRHPPSRIEAANTNAHRRA